MPRSGRCRPGCHTHPPREKNDLVKLLLLLDPAFQHVAVQPIDVDGHGFLFFRDGVPARPLSDALCPKGSREGGNGTVPECWSPADIR
ncbi:hypothetical protein [Neolewinella xylanilytica]|uniref:hypothetical protein n=1 Tax=Neolewinella xylanilytica TaxID=1514080 RepID=UPI0011B09D2A|nr:hypothetical protein [Neolewinella xylanilytica]